MTDESHLDLEFGLTLWVNENQDEKQQFSSGVLFLAVWLPAKLSEPRAREG
jgi:hypothetical protein